jgi:hypothetical protein
MTFDAIGLRSTATTQDICVLRNCLKMLWVYATRHSAEVINNHPLRNRAYECFIGDAMCLSQFACILNESVAVMINGKLPHPASRRSDFRISLNPDVYRCGGIASHCRFASHVCTISFTSCLSRACALSPNSHEICNSL